MRWHLKMVEGEGKSMMAKGQEGGVEEAGVGGAKVGGGGEEEGGRRLEAGELLVTTPPTDWPTYTDALPGCTSLKRE